MQWPFHLRRVLKAHLPSLLKDDPGQGLVEYALIVALVVLASIAVLQVFACRVNCAFEAVANQAEHIFTKGKKAPPGQQKQCSKKCA
jgi:Flp pilus assembly pilin Flp